jgi:hypothetical protein
MLMRSLMFLTVLGAAALSGCPVSKNGTQAAVGEGMHPASGDSDGAGDTQVPAGPAIAATADEEGPAIVAAADAAGQNEWRREALGSDATEPFGVAARTLIDELAGHYIGTWPQTSGLGALQLELSYEGAALSLDTRTALSANPQDRNADGIADGSVRIVAPMTMRLVSANGDLVLTLPDAPVMIYEAHAGSLAAVITFSALSPSFDTARITQPNAATCDLGWLDIVVQGGRLQLVALTFEKATSGSCGTVRAADLRREG